MRYRRMGNTDLTVSEIGFGCGNTAGLMSWGDLDDQVRAAQHAMDLGVNFFDTATTYGQSEENLGRILPRLSERPLIATKVDITQADLDAPGDIVGAVRRSVEGSLRRLGTDCLDLVQLHNRVVLHRGEGWSGRNPPLTVAELLERGGVQDGFQALEREGKLRYYGFCASGDDAAASNQVLARGEFHTVLVYYNVLNPSAGRAMPPQFQQVDFAGIMATAAARGIGTVVLRVLDGGALSGEATPHPMNRGDIRSDPGYAHTALRARALEFLKRDTDETLAQVAIRFALQSPDVSTVLVGFSDLPQIDAAVACSGREGFSATELARLEELYSTDFGLLGARITT